ncbi:MAG TPA: T9SS type A sorting domain-containing protein, partial [Cryomorphaceae bacterium]|nr:T9SS type A sorting domain-containing protein [Cryomorphaceae bacterium]
EEEFNSVAMTAGEGVEWLAIIPAQEVGSIIEYYVSAIAENGKTQVRPIVAPEGFWSFEVLGTITSVDTQKLISMAKVYPNPAMDLVSIPINARRELDVTVYMTDITGKVVKEIHSGTLFGDRRLSVFVSDLASGVYTVVAEGVFGRVATPLLVR